jgi:hypothetical protein
MKTIITLLFLLLILFSGCQKVVDADNLLDTEEKVYILSYIAPTDTLLTVSVTKALPVIGTPLSVRDNEENILPFLIKDALVTISDTNGNSIQLFYSDNVLAYTANVENFSIIEGEEYFLEVIAQEKTYTASCKIPEKIDEILEKFVNETSEYGSYIDINIGFKDVVDQDNFYRVGATIEVFYEGDSYQNNLYFETGGFLTDAIKDGATLNDKTSIYTGSPEEGTSRILTLQVANLEEIVYQNLRASYLNNQNDGNPFVEYSIAPNNIVGNNGVGVFGGYQLTEKIIELK